MKRKLKDLFREAYRKLFRKKTRGKVWMGFDGSATTYYVRGVQIAPENFRELFKAAYPDGAKFLQQMHVIPDTNDVFLFSGSFAASGFLSAMGFPATYREWERQRVQEIKEKYPNLKILVLHEDFPTDEEV